MTVMRFRWKRGRIRGKQLLCYICLGVLIVVICRAIGKNVAQFERDWTCEELRARERLTQLCEEFNRGITGGNLCQDLCNNNELVIQDCLAHKNTTIVFSGTWKDKDIVFKTKREPHYFEKLKDLIYAELGDDDQPTLDQGRIHELFLFNVFEHVINELSIYQLRDTVTKQRVFELLWHPHPVRKLSWADMSSLWLLIQRDEFIKLQLLKDMKHIPQVYGFCGRFYAVEKVETLDEFSFTPFKKPMPWKKRLQIALDFLELVQEFSKSSLGQLHHCDIQPGNFGVTKDMRVIALDIDTVFPTNQMENFLEQPACESNKQCDFFDCVSACNQTVQKCSRNILTNNLQVICRDILLSRWEQPGLLQRAPVFAQNKISTVLAECVSSETLLPWKQSKRDRIYKQLKRILTELTEE